jgi:hypothetical protein
MMVFRESVLTKKVPLQRSLDFVAVFYGEGRRSD